MTKTRFIWAFLIYLFLIFPASALDFPWLSWSVRTVDQITLQDPGLSLASIHINQGNHRRALEILKTLSQKEVRDANVHVLMSRAHQRLGNLEEAMRQLDSALALAPSAEILMEKASLYREQVQIDAAKAFFSTVPQKFPALAADGHKILGTIYLLEDFDGQSGLNEFRQALNANPNDVVNVFGVGNALYVLKRFDEALPYMQKAISLLESLPRPPKRLLADAYLTLSGIQGEKALRGSLFDLIKYGPQVKKHIDKGCQIDPGDPWCTYAQARYYLEAPGIVGGNPPKAIPLLQKAWRQEPRTWPFHLYLIKAYAVNQQMDLARSELQKFITRHRDNPIAMGYVNRHRDDFGL